MENNIITVDDIFENATILWQEGKIRMIELELLRSILNHIANRKTFIFSKEHFKIDTREINYDLGIPGFMVKNINNVILNAINNLYLNKVLSIQDFKVNKKYGVEFSYTVTIKFYGCNLRRNIPKNSKSNEPF